MVEDIALMRVLPNMRVLVPADYYAAKAAIKLAAETPGPVYVRMGRASVPCVYEPGKELEMGRAYVLREGSDVSIVACGVEIDEALKAADLLAAEGISAEVIDAFCVKPLDEDTILASVEKTGCIVTAEEHSVIGGLVAPWRNAWPQSIPLRSSAWACRIASARRQATRNCSWNSTWMPPLSPRRPKRLSLANSALERRLFKAGFLPGLFFMSVCIVWPVSFLGAALLHAFRLYSVQCLFRSEASRDLRVLVE